MSVLERPDTLDETLLEDTLQCKGGHIFCTTDATHAIVWCMPAVPVCDGYVELHMPHARRQRCGGCGKPIGECWRAVPI